MYTLSFLFDNWEKYGRKSRSIRNQHCKSSESNLIIDGILRNTRLLIMVVEGNPLILMY